MRKIGVFIVVFMLAVGFVGCTEQDLDSEISENQHDKIYPSGQILVENSCETLIDGVNLLEGAIDGSKYYQTKADQRADLPGLPGNSTDLLVWSMDIRFDQEGAGFTPMGRGDKWGTCVRARTMDGKYQLVVQTGGNSFTRYMEIDSDEWYHIELMGKYSAPDAFFYMLVWKYNQNGERTELRIFDNVNLRNLYANNHSGASFFRVEPNTSVDNVRIFKPAVDNLILSTSSDVLLSGQELQFDVNGSRYGIKLNLEETVYYQIYDANGKPLNDPSITIDNNGLLKVGQFATDQDIFVHAVDGEGTLSNTIKIEIKSSSTLEILSLGFNEEFTKVIDLELAKNFYYEGSAVCIIEVYDHNQVLRDSVIRNIAGNLVPVKEPYLVPINYSLPSEFVKDTWQIKVFLVSSID